MIRAALALAAARAAAPLDAATTKRLDHLQALLHRGHAHATPLPTWNVRRRDADAIDWTPLANGSAKAVASGAWRGTRVVRKRVKCTDPITTLAHTRGRRKRPLPKMEKHFAEAVAELFFMEHLRGRPGIPVLRGAWYTHQGLEYVVDDAGPPLLGQGAARKTVARDIARRRPLRLAQALLECFRSFSEEGGYFLDDLTWRQFSLREEAGKPPVVTIVDGPKALDAPVRPYLGESGHVLPLPNSTACSLNSQCPATRKHHSCIDNGVGTSRAGLVDEAALASWNATTACYWRPGSRAQGVPERAAAPEAEGWCASFDASGVRARHCVPWTSKTHVYDVGGRGWALGFLEDHARNPASRRIVVGLRRKMVGKAVAARPSFSEALAWLAARAEGIKEGLCCTRQLMLRC